MNGNGNHKIQIRTIDKSRIVKKLGTISELESKTVLDTLQYMFAE